MVEIPLCILKRQITHLGQFFRQLRPVCSHILSHQSLSVLLSLLSPCSPHDWNNGDSSLLAVTRNASWSTSGCFPSRRCCNLRWLSCVPVQWEPGRVCVCAHARACLQIIVPCFPTPVQASVNTARWCHEFCFWCSSPTAGAQGCTFAVVSEPPRSHLSQVVGVGRGRRVLPMTVIPLWPDPSPSSPSLASEKGTGA